jgi:hypothetical protein
MLYEGHWIKRSIQIKVYKLYLKGLPVELIGLHLNLGENDVNNIIDYINEIYH